MTSTAFSEFMEIIDVYWDDPVAFAEGMLGFYHFSQEDSFLKEREVSRWEMNWLRTRDGRKPSYLLDIHKLLLHYLSNVRLLYNRHISKWG
ncbi:hypothetical protein [Bacillus sp. FSL R9-9410]|uniref:hypothetical protein n=1 Tax=Bacillus sp. FSL R9-9410 TaxID=2921590 RepID=UPI003101985A